MAELQNDILDYLKDNPEASADEIAAEFNVKSHVMAKQLKDMRIAGVIKYGRRREGGRTFTWLRADDDPPARDRDTLHTSADNDMETPVSAGSAREKNLAQVADAADQTAQGGEQKPSASFEAEATGGDGLDNMNLSELRDVASERDLEGRSGMNKQQLIEALRRG